jgi:hypothetical protein
MKYQSMKGCETSAIYLPLFAFRKMKVHVFSSTSFRFLTSMVRSVFVCYRHIPTPLALMSVHLSFTSQSCSFDAGLSCHCSISFTLDIYLFSSTAHSQASHISLRLCPSISPSFNRLPVIFATNVDEPDEPSSTHLFLLPYAIAPRQYLYAGPFLKTGKTVVVRQTAYTLPAVISDSKPHSS